MVRDCLSVAWAEDNMPVASLNGRNQDIPRSRYQTLRSLNDLKLIDERSNEHD